MLDTLPDDTCSLSSYPMSCEFSGGDKVRPSTPEAGRSLFSAVAKVGAPVRSAARVLASSSKHQTSDIEKILEPFSWQPGFGGHYEDSSVRAAWLLVNIAILWHLETNLNDTKIDFYSAAKWFFGPDEDFSQILLNGFEPKALSKACECLGTLTLDDDLVDLLPYILEPHDPASRLTVRRDSDTSRARQAKKGHGVFYTPSDVAEFLVCSVGHKRDGLWLDPACGTGVFLKAVLQRFPDANIMSIYGIDISALSVESSVFVLMATFRDRTSSIDVLSPYRCWLAIRMNFAVGNSLFLTDVESNPSLKSWRDDARSRILSDERLSLKPSYTYEPAGVLLCPTALSEIFPEADDGFDRVVMNPPYANAPATQTMKENWKSFSELSLGSQAKSYLAFVEMLWRFAKSKGSASAAVLPLSIAVNQDKQTGACRKVLSSSGGEWTLLFYDREPHALFGEEVKTRNSILIRRNDGDSTRIYSSSFRKWRSGNRQSIFQDNFVTQILPEDISAYVPKLGTTDERHAYEILKSFQTQEAIADVCGGIQLTDIAQTKCCRSVYVGGTAYNFLNAFLSVPSQEAFSSLYSASAVSHIRASSQRDAYAAYAIIISRLSHWLWRVEGDGFHVTRGFLKRLPLLRLRITEQAKNELEEAGKTLWEEARKGSKTNVNGGRLTISHMPPAEHQASKKIEKILLDTAGIHQSFSLGLERFVASTVLIDDVVHRSKNDHQFGIAGE